MEQYPGRALCRVPNELQRVECRLLDFSENSQEQIGIKSLRKADQKKQLSCEENLQGRLNQGIVMGLDLTRTDSLLNIFSLKLRSVSMEKRIFTHLLKLCLETESARLFSTVLLSEPELHTIGHSQSNNRRPSLACTTASYHYKETRVEQCQFSSFNKMNHMPLDSQK